MSSTPPPLFPAAPPPPPRLPPDRKTGLGGCTLAALILGGLALLLVVAAVLAIPTLRKVQEKARQLSEEQRAQEQQRLAALKPAAPLSEEQKAGLLAFGEALAAELSEGDMEAVARRIDVEAMTDRVFIPLGSAAQWVGARRGYMGAVGKMGGGLVQVPAGSDVKALRVLERDGSPAVMIRLLFPEGAMSFIDVLVRVDGEKFEMIDVYNHVFGIMASEEARNGMLAMIPNAGDAFFSALFGKAGTSKAKIEALLEMKALINKGDLARAQEYYAGLPAAARKERLVFLQYLHALSNDPAASEETQDRYYQALVEAPEILGENGATELLRVDIEFMNGNYAETERLLERAEEKLGRDAYLTSLRATMMLHQENLAGARQLAKEAAGMEPDLINLVDLRLSIHAHAKDHAALLQELRDFKTQRDRVIPAEALEDEQFEAFRQSPEFEVWKAENP